MLPPNEVSSLVCNHSRMCTWEFQCEDFIAHFGESAHLLAPQLQ